MTTAEKVELALVPIVGGAAWMLAPAAPGKLDLGTLLLWSSALLLFQGLMRDLWLLRKVRKTTQRGSVQRLSCMCVESTAGVTGVVVGIALVGIGLDKSVVMNRCRWCSTATVVVILGFTMKDYVYGWRPFKIYRVKDHSSIVFTWKK